MFTPSQKKLAIKVIESRDPVNHFFGLNDFTQLCTESQLAACTAAPTLNYILLTTANQGGKTTAAIFDCGALARGKHPSREAPSEPISILIVVPSRAQAAGIWGKRLLEASDLRQTVTDPLGNEINLSNIPIIPKHEIEHIDYSPSPQGKYPGLIRLKNKNEIRIGLSGDVKSWERVQGFPLDAIYRDEAVGNKNLHAELSARLTVSQSLYEQGKRKWGGFIYWVATSTLASTEFEDYKMRCMNNEPQHAIFWMDPNENPAVSSQVRENMRGAMSEDEASIRLDGTGSAAGNLRIFPRFSVDRNVLPETLGIRPLDNIWLGWDPGWDHPSGLIALIVGPEHVSRLRLSWALAIRNKTIEYIADVFAEFLDGRVAEAFVFDPAAKRTEQGRGQSLAFQMEQCLAAKKIKTERGILFGRNRYEDTIPLMDRYICPQSSDTPYLVIDQPTETNGTARAIEQLMKYRRKATNVEGNHPPMGATVFKQDDDLVDPIRYIISRQPQYVARRPHSQELFVEKRRILISNEVPQPELSEDMKMHLARLKMTDAYPISSNVPFAQLPTGRLLW